MKTYNLTTHKLHKVVDEVDYFCLLGVYLKEKGVPIEVLDKEDYSTAGADEYAEDIKRMSEYFQEKHPFTVFGTGSGVYAANDRVEPDSPCACAFCVSERPDETRTFVFSTEELTEALKLVGIEVELVDMRGKK